MTVIKRMGPSRLSPTRCRTVVYNGVVTTVATSMTKPASLYEQARDVLAVIDKHLVEAGSNKSRILTVTAFVTDITKKSELNRAWDEWVDRANLPMRACIGATLEGDDLIELIVTAAVNP